MSKQFNYNFEKYSAKDVGEFIEGLGYKIEFQKNIPCGGPGFVVVGMDLMVTLQDFDLIKKINKNLIYLYPRVYWKTMNKLYMDLYHAKESKDLKHIGEMQKKYDNYYTQVFVVFNKLKKNFAMKKDDNPKTIKDLDWLKSLK